MVCWSSETLDLELKTGSVTVITFFENTNSGNSILAIGTVGGSPRKVKDRERFESGLRELVNRKHPQVLIVYESDHYPIFRELDNQGIRIVSFKSKTATDSERICNV